MNATVTLPIAGDRKKNPDRVTMRPLDIAEVMAKSYKGQIYAQDNWEMCFLRVRYNGQVKTWITRPQAFRLPMKYGLKCCFAVEGSGDGTYYPVLYVPVEP